MAGGSNRTTTTTNTTQQSAPWEPAQGALIRNLDRAAQIYDYQNQNGIVYTGATVAPFSAETNNAFAQQAAIAGRSAPALQNSFDGINQLRGAVSREAMGDLSGNMTGGAYLNQAIETMRPIAMGDFRNDITFGQTLGRAQQDAADSVNNAMSAAGRYGSGIHQGALGREITDATNRAMLDRQAFATNALRGYSGDVMARQQSGSNQAQSLAAALPAAYQAQLMPSQTLQSIGAQKEAMHANQLEADAARFQAYVDAPWQNLERYNAMVGGAGALGGTSTGGSTSVHRTPNNFGQQALGFGATALGTGIKGVK